MIRLAPRRPDRKVEAIAEAPIGRDRSGSDLVALCHYGELVSVDPGTLIQQRDAWETWTYHVVRGLIVLRTADRIVGLAAGGSWLFGSQPQRTREASPVSAAAVDHAQLLVFRARDLERAVAEVPDLIPPTIAASLRRTNA